MIKALFTLVLLSLVEVAIAESPSGSKPPIIYDAMIFAGKPNLGLSQDVGFMYEWEATLHDEGRDLAARGSDGKPSSRTIETKAFSRAVASRLGRHKYLVIDIESLEPEDDAIAIQYVETAKGAAPGLKIAWWNTGPRYIIDTVFHPFDRTAWVASWRKRHDLEQANDFFIFGSYFLQSTDTLEDWAKREIPRIVEVRRQFPDKLLFVTIAPHPFFAGEPWGHVSSELMGGAIDRLAREGVDGIVLWSFEGTGRLQKWDEKWTWVSALRKRIGSDGRYRAP